MKAGVTGTFRPDGTTQKGSTCIETTLRMTDHPAVTPGLCIRRALLRLHHQSDAAQLITAVSELVPMTTLKHKVRKISGLQPSTGLGRILHVDAVKQNVTVGLSKFNKHGQEPWGRVMGPRRDSPQLNSMATTTRVIQSG